jgi:hypothetical protein
MPNPFLSKLMHSLNRVKKYIAQNACYLCNIKKLPKVNDHLMGENLPNLVTLIVTLEPNLTFPQFQVVLSHDKKVEDVQAQVPTLKQDTYICMCLCT